MRSSILHRFIIVFLISLFWGCALPKNAKNNVTVTPEYRILTPGNDGQVAIDFVLHVPDKHFSKRSRLIIVPQLVMNDTVVDEFQPIVIDHSIYDKKMKRLMELEGYTDPYLSKAQYVDGKQKVIELPYREEITWPAEASSGFIRAVLTTDGCGECSGFDTLNLAAINNPINLLPVKKSLKLSWIEPEFVVRPKVMKGEGIANLQFAINKYDIDLNLGNNNTELVEMRNSIASILEDSLAMLTSLEIYGMASADGSLSFNTHLARQRARTAIQWIATQLHFDAATRRIVKVGSRPEGWTPVLTAMIVDHHPDTTAVKDILERYADSGDDIQEQYIRRLPCWKIIRDNYLSRDRKVVYVYTYSVKSFTTDKELLEMYGKRPDAFNEEELLRVASLLKTHEAKKEVYTTILKYFPQSKVATNNLAVLWLRENNEQEARALLERMCEYSPETLNTLAASYVYTGDYERAIELLQDVELPEARYNMGLIKAKQRKLHEAYELLRPFNDLNSAIAALSVNRNQEAKLILQGIKIATPVAEYVRSMTAARLKEDAMFFLHIGNACQDPHLRKRAVTEPDFRPYQLEELFQQIVNH